MKRSGLKGPLLVLFLAWAPATVLLAQATSTFTPTSTPSTFSGTASYYFSNCSSTFFCTGTGFPGCTNQSAQSPAQYIVAMNTTDLGTVVSCSQCIVISSASATITAQVVDACPGCFAARGAHSFDLDPAAAVLLDPSYIADGTFSVTWSTGAACAPTDTPTPTPSSTSTVAAPTATSTFTKTSTSTATFTSTFTKTPTYSFTATPSTPAGTPTNSPTRTPTNTTTNTPTNTPTNSPTRTPTNSSTSTPTNSQTNTPLVPTVTATFTSTATPTSTAIATATFTSTLTPAVPIPTATTTWTPTVPALIPSATPIPTPPSPGGDCSGSLATYAYPNPASGNSLSLVYDLCEASSVMVLVYDAGGRWVASVPASGLNGANTQTLDISGYSHGVYFYLVRATGPSGQRTSKSSKFAIIRSP